MKTLILAHLVIMTALLGQRSAYGSASSYPASTPASRLTFATPPPQRKNQPPAPAGRPRSAR